MIVSYSESLKHSHIDHKIHKFVSVLVFEYSSLHFVPSPAESNTKFTRKAFSQQTLVIFIQFKMNTRSLLLVAILIATLSVAMATASVEGKEVDRLLQSGEILLDVGGGLIVSLKKLL